MNCPVGDHNCQTPQARKGKSTALLDLEADNGNHSKSSIESKLLFCKREDFLKPRIAKSEKSNNLDNKPSTCALPESDVLGRVKNFLGVISEANKKLQVDAEGNSEKYDIEILNGNETELIEMDLMLGVADLPTPEAVAAAELAMAGYQSAAVSDSSDTDDDDEETDDSDSNNETLGGSDDDRKMSTKAVGESSSEVLKKPSKKRPKIVELS